MEDTQNKHLSYESIISISAVLLVLIPLIAVVIVSIYSSSHALTSSLEKELEKQSILMGFSINSFLNERITDARVISQADVLEQGNINKKIRYLTEVVKENQWIDDIDVVNTEGKIILSSRVQNEKGMFIWHDHAEYKSLFQATSKASQGQVFVSEATSIDSGFGILLMTPITDDSNTKVIALLAIDVNFNDIERVLSLLNQQLMGSRFVYIVDNNGKIIASNNPAIAPLEVFPDLQVQPSLLKAFSRQGEIGNVVYKNAEGVEVMTTYADLGEFGENSALDWSIVVTESLDKVAAPVAYLTKLLIILSSFIALVSMLFAYRLSRAYSHSLEKFALRAKAISNGVYSAEPVNNIKRKGALNTLRNAFNKMEQNLNTLINELKDREQRLDITLNSIGDGVIATDKNGCVTRMNPAAERMTGWQLKDAKGKFIVDVFPIVDETSREPIQNPIEKVIATGRTVYLSNHTTLLSKDGSEHQIEDSAAPICDDDKNIHGMILIFSDVTRRKQAEKKYRSAAKMDALGKLTGGIAHDYNNMLGVIMGYCELLDEKLSKQPELKEYINTIQESAQRGANLTKKLLDFSRHKPAVSKKINLHTLLFEHELMLQKTLTARIDLRLKSEHNLWPIYVDESDIVDAILNMCINAMHAIEGNGQLTIETSNTTLNEDDAKNIGLKAGDYVVLNITDTGCGMDNSTRDKIFDPFFSTKGEKGTGLGLSQVYGFMQRSKGVITVYSEVGKGSQFTLYFPRYHEISKTDDNQSSDNELNYFLEKNRPETILVVDDEVDLANFCCHVLESNGFKTLSANSAQAALEILKHEKVDILISDIIMPEMDGYQLACIVSEKYPHIKIQLASGFTDDRNVDESCVAPQKNILNKPYTAKDILQCLSELVS